MATPIIDLEEREVQYAATKTFTFPGSTLPAGLYASTYKVGKAGAPLAHKFDAENVKVRNGFLELVVPGGQQGKSTISSAEVETTFTALYGSVRTWAVLTETPGVCNGTSCSSLSHHSYVPKFDVSIGLFFYKSDSQESDIEWISDPQSHSNLDSPTGHRMMQYTNQALDGNPDDATMFYGAAPSDATSAVHEYRLDWQPGSTSFYVDGVLQRRIKKNVPDQPAAWIINNWVNGDPYWTRGPPKVDAVLKIQKIVIAYNP